MLINTSDAEAANNRTGHEVHSNPAFRANCTKSADYGKPSDADRNEHLGGLDGEFSRLPPIVRRPLPKTLPGFREVFILILLSRAKLLTIRFEHVHSGCRIETHRSSPSEKVLELLPRALDRTGDSMGGVWPLTFQAIENQVERLLDRTAKAPGLPKLLRQRHGPAVQIWDVSAIRTEQHVIDIDQ